ncbi:MAG: type II toxin-antitoxin system VapC family toxin [Deltaproteobacteria bacterium]|nr:type II toxin-antitoxin system VapC family toxin [Deltaproteobacteria bacterium]
MRLFLDSSALAKRYVEESGTVAVADHCAQATEILLCIVTIPEMISAFNRLRREKKLTAKHYRQMKADFARDIEQATILDLSELVLQYTIQCLERAPLKALDALQLGCALSAHCDLFLSADQRQLQAARRLRLPVESV